MSKIIRLPSLVAAAASLALCSSADAATVTIGSPLTNTPIKGTCGGPSGATFTDTALGAGTLAAPSNGVIVRWRLAVHESSGSKTYELRVLHPNGGLSYTGAGTGPPQSAAAAGMNELTLPSPLPVQAGDIVAINCPAGAPSPFTSSGTKGSIYGFLSPTLADGSTGTVKTFPGDELLINADFVGAPTVTSIAPSSGSFKGGISVVITGTNFLGASTVSFGGAPAKSFTVNSDTQISAISPPTSRPASLAIAVTSVAGTATSPTAFTTTACVVPKLKGKRLKADRKKLKKAGCRLGRVKKSKGAEANTGKVVKQSPKPGKLLAPGSKVSVKLGG